MINMAATMSRQRAREGEGARLVVCSYNSTSQLLDDSTTLLLYKQAGREMLALSYAALLCAHLAFICALRPFATTRE